MHGMIGGMATLESFTEPVRAWFDASFGEPTRVQQEAWSTIQTGSHALIIAPTGSGKTLAAFLQCLDWLSKEAAASKVQVLYISPLKALAADIEANLRAPLRGIQLARERLGLPSRSINVGVRTGDTSAAERRRLAAKPPEILITTPESLFLMLSSQVASTLDEVKLVIVDEIHSLAGTKRGAHLAVSLERISAAAGADPQRVGLSATVRPADRVARFLGGDREVRVVSPPANKVWDLQVCSPVPDFSDLPADTPSAWPLIEKHILAGVDAHNSTICFVNSRRVSERLTARLNELHAERLGQLGCATNMPASYASTAGSTKPVLGQFDPIAQAHHGSVAHPRRKEIESALKSGQLPCVVATSSLELGIDMGAVDLVVQVDAPPSVASGLQRLGRAGHQVGATSVGRIMPTNQGAALESVVVAEAMLAGRLEEVRDLLLPLDVLAQQIVSSCLDTSVSVPDLHGLLRRSAPFADLSAELLHAVLHMLAGRYPSEEFAELRPRIIWDQVKDEISARPGARRLVTTSGGTIPDRGLYGVYLVGEGNASGKHSPGRRVGELDEEMVHESRVGDIITLGTTSWQIADITAHQVLVTPASGVAGRLPFWHGDAIGRPAELGRAIGRFQREVLTSDRPTTVADENTTANITRFLREQRDAVGSIPDDQQIIVERFRDELGDWRVCVHSPFGLGVNSPWALAIEHRINLRDAMAGTVQATNDGIIFRLPDTDDAPPGASLVAFDAAEISDLVSSALPHTALFAARFRECAARALLLPRRDPGRRTPLWQQRQRASQLLSVAAQYPDFPIMLETFRECFNDVFDMPALMSVVAGIASRKIRLLEVETASPSPFARRLLFGHVAEFLYDGDQPLAERRMAALSLDTALLAELLGRQQLLDDLDQAVLDEVARDLAGAPPTTSEALWDQIRTRGPLPEAEASPTLAEPLLVANRIAKCNIAARPCLITTEDLPLLRDGLGVPPPPGYPMGPAVDPDEAIKRLILRRLRTSVVVTPEAIADTLGIPVKTATVTLDSLVADGTAIAGRFSATTAGKQYMHHLVLERVKRTALRQLRADIAPVEQQDFVRFLLSWHELDHPSPGVDAVLTAAEQLAGYPIPASMLESLVLPTRVSGFHPSQLDELLGNGELLWTGHSALGLNDGYVTLWPADIFPGVEQASPLGLADELYGQLSAGGAWRFDDLLPKFPNVDRQQLRDALWELVWLGLVTSDSFAPIRALSTNGTLKRRAPARAGRRMVRIPRVVDSTVIGRWSALPTASGTNPTQARVQELTIQLNRYGVLTRGSLMTEPNEPSFGAAYRDLVTLEERGTVRRGYFIAGLGASQFALPGAVDALRDPPSWNEPIVLAATDPANPFGAALPWPETKGHRPSRKAGALVVLLAGKPVWFCERGMGSLVSFGGVSHDGLAAGIFALGMALKSSKSTHVRIITIDGEPSITATHLHEPLTQSGFALTPGGYRLRAF